MLSPTWTKPVKSLPEVGTVAELSKIRFAFSAGSRIFRTHPDSNAEKDSAKKDGVNLLIRVPDTIQKPKFSLSGLAQQVDPRAVAHIRASRKLL
jgi:hypothetical protein